ncbi:ribosome maturation factor RimM [Salinibacterium sp. ZJ454]|uniref:ribosome maturation factor RimM n=1 Tax=Salinibacterium sp. ZJ454 TaxID=2708339 RepID=UPI00141F5DAB|nr:ribosome maturation factor RimM [Salinibacterium sp. ZJ454]
MASAFVSTSSTPTTRNTLLVSSTSSPQPNRTQLRVGRLTKAHGLKGAIKLELFTDEPERRFVPGAQFTLQVPSESPWHGKTLELVELRWYNGHPVGFFKGVPDRSAAETLLKAILWVDQDVTELPAEEDAWYDHQLVGLRVLRDGVTVGTVTRVDHMPAQDLLVVKTDADEVLVPFVKAIVSAVDIKAGTVTVTPPIGLFEEIPDDAEPKAVRAAGESEQAEAPEPSEPSEPAELAEPTDAAESDN